MSAEKLREAAERVLQYPIDQGCAGHKQFAQDLKLAADACTTLAAQMEHKGEQYERWRKRDGMQGISEVAQRQERCAYYAGYEAATAQMQAKLDAAKAQLPAGMQECTIEFRACPVGHGRLMATNWTDHGCLVCERDAEERARKRANVAVVLAQEIIAKHTAALATVKRERELLRKEVRRLEQWLITRIVLCDSKNESAAQLVVSANRSPEVRALVGTTADIKDT